MTGEERVGTVDTVFTDFGSMMSMPISGLELPAIEDGGEMLYHDTSQNPDRITPTDGVGIELLAAAIIEKACDDYRVAYLTDDDKRMNEIERFFKSKYFHSISLIDPQWLIDGLKEKYEEERKSGKRRPGRPSKYEMP